MKSRLLLTLLPLLMTAAPALRAQEPAAPAVPASTGKVSMKLDIVSWGGDLTGLTFKSAGAGQPITALAFRYSKPINYSGPDVLEIFQSPADAAKATSGIENGAPVPADLQKRRKDDPTLVAIAKLPLNSSRATVLIAPAQGGTYQTFVIDDDPSKLPFGKLRIHNYSPLRIAMRCNNGKAGKEMAIKDTFVVDPVKGEVLYELAYQKDSKWKTQENNVIPVAGNEQVQLVVLQSKADFFQSSDGSRSGFLQTVVLRRAAEPPAPR